MNLPAAKRRVKKLRDEINHHRYLYHVKNTQEISEAALDSLKHELLQLETEFPQLITKDSPTQRVSGKALEQFSQITHASPMRSLHDVFSVEEMQDWEERLQKEYDGKFEYYAEIKNGWLGRIAGI